VFQVVKAVRHGLSLEIDHQIKGLINHIHGAQGSLTIGQGLKCIVQLHAEVCISRLWTVCNSRLWTRVLHKQVLASYVRALCA